MGDVLSHLVLDRMRWLHFIALLCARQKSETIWHRMETGDLKESSFMAGWIKVQEQKLYRSLWPPVTY